MNLGSLPGHQTASCRMGHTARRCVSIYSSIQDTPDTAVFIEVSNDARCLSSGMPHLLPRAAYHQALLRIDILNKEQLQLIPAGSAGASLPPGAVISGQPGIGQKCNWSVTCQVLSLILTRGKSLFLDYCLINLLSRRIPVVFQASPKSTHLYCEEGVYDLSEVYELPDNVTLPLYTATPR